MGAAPERCPRCGGGNIIGYKGKWECMDCGYRFFIRLKKGGLNSFPEKAILEESPRKVKRIRRTLALVCLLIISFLICGYIGYCIGAVSYTHLTLPTN